MTLRMIEESQFWKSWGVLAARIIMAGVFALGCYFKFTGIDATAGYIASVGFPLPLISAWLAAFFELFIVVAFLTGWYLRTAAMLAIPYILLLAFLFHGPSTFANDQNQFGFFVDHFTFAAGLLYMVAGGTMNSWTLKKFW